MNCTRNVDCDRCYKENDGCPDLLITKTLTEGHQAESATVSSLSELLAMLEPLLGNISVEITQGMSGAIEVDLNTRAKSSCVLKPEKDGVWAYGRYDLREKVGDLDDVISIVHGCAHGRSYFNPGWLEIFDKYGFSNPCGCL